jgi:SAM-dependent methyltransferase
MESLYDRIVGAPFVYDYVRPFFFGGFDFSAFYRDLAASDDSVIVDVGCGTGIALAHLDRFAAYHGFDVDSRALRVARQRYGSRSNVSFYERTLGSDDIAAIRPTSAILMGLLHHLSDAEAHSLLAMLSAGRLERIVTLDAAFITGKWINNTLCRLDRGRFVRDEPRYRTLAKDAGLTITSSRWFRSGNRLGWYYSMTLAPGGG